jgi:hypothetical protein
MRLGGSLARPSGAGAAVETALGYRCGFHTSYRGTYVAPLACANVPSAAKRPSRATLLRIDALPPHHPAFGSRSKRGAPKSSGTSLVPSFISGAEKMPFLTHSLWPAA